jgi:hypothetical protein
MGEGADLGFDYLLRPDSRMTKTKAEQLCIYHRELLVLTWFLRL